MAFWQRKGTAVYVYISVDGKQTVLPRHLTRHLDAEPNHNIEYHVREFERQYETPKRRFDASLVLGPEMDKLLEGWFRTRLAAGRDRRMLRGYRSLLVRHIIPFFLTQVPPMRDINLWPTASIRLLPFLLERIGHSRIRLAYSALRQLWQYADEEGIIVTDKRLKFRNPPVLPKTTPLKHVIDPETVLDFVRNTPRREIRLMALLGYFFSLRPMEVFAVKKEQFRAGTKAVELECGKVLAQYGLFGRLAVYMEYARAQDGTEKKLKTKDSKGWVGCFSEPAARLLLDLIRDEEPGALLFREWKPDWYLKIWAAHGIPNTVLKDMRRGSLYWLGHHIGMQPLHLKHHARHARFDTTLLYLRRPDEYVAETLELDLDA